MVGYVIAGAIHYVVPLPPDASPMEARIHLMSPMLVQVSAGVLQKQFLANTRHYSREKQNGADRLGTRSAYGS
jgi:hypothetical protein